MRILVSEFLCGGGWPEAELPDSLATEGRAMLEAVVTDLLRLPEVTVLTTWDARLALPSFCEDERVEVIQVCAPAEEQTILTQSAQRVDRALIIAPEFARILEQRCTMLSTMEVSLLNCSPEAIRLCADKFAVFQLCEQLALPTIPTRLINEQAALPPWLPCVIKLRDGAGSMEMKLIASSTDRERWQQQTGLHFTEQKFITQPYLPGRSYSVAAICEHGRIRSLLPTAEQHFAREPAFHYRGGSIPDWTVDRNRIQSMVERFITHVPGLHGYVGFDFMLHEKTGELLLIEVNPRLSTSYVGYRQICTDALVRWIIDPAHIPAPEFMGSVTFSTNGTVLKKY